MTIEEFKKMKFHFGMKGTYKGIEYDIVSVDFEECLFGFMISQFQEDSIYMVRCENFILSD